MGWVKPVERNEWGARQVFFGDPGNIGTGKWSLAPITPEIGAGEIRVLWPDGTDETLPVIMRKDCYTYGDMGHDYEVYSMLPYIKILHHGQAFEHYLPVAGVMVWKAE